MTRHKISLSFSPQRWRPSLSHQRSGTHVPPATESQLASLEAMSTQLNPEVEFTLLPLEADTPDVAPEQFQSPVSGLFQGWVFRVGHGWDTAAPLDTVVGTKAKPDPKQQDGTVLVLMGRCSITSLLIFRQHGLILVFIPVNHPQQPDQQGKTSEEFRALLVAREKVP